jgi:hypothetical protein
MSSNEGPESRQSSRWKYSLRTLLLIVVIVCLAIPLVLQSFKLRRVEAELRRLRIETGQLTVDDPTKVHVVAVETDEPNTWRWRMFLPKGVRYTWCLGYGDIPAQGVPQPKMESSSNVQYSETPAEVLIDARLRQLDDDRWSLKVSSKIGDREDQMNGTRLIIPDEDMRWTREVPSTQGSVLGSRGTEVLDPAGPIVLLMRRSNERQPAGSFRQWAPSANPMPGYMIWLQRDP